MATGPPGVGGQVPFVPPSPRPAANNNHLSTYQPSSGGSCKLLGGILLLVLLANAPRTTAAGPAPASTPFAANAAGPSWLAAPLGAAQIAIQPGGINVSSSTSPPCGHVHQQQFRLHQNHLWPLDKQDYLLALAVAVSLLLAGGAGIGGGGILVPLFNNLGTFAIHEGVALANITILGCALAGFVMTARRRRPDGRPLIYWDLILVFEPATVIGALVGGYLHKVFPVWLTTVLLSFLLLFLCSKMLRKALSTYSRETQLITAIRQRSTARQRQRQQQQDGQLEAQQPQLEVLLETGNGSEQQEPTEEEETDEENAAAADGDAEAAADSTTNHLQQPLLLHARTAPAAIASRGRRTGSRTAATAGNWIGLRQHSSSAAQQSSLPSQQTGAWFSPRAAALVARSSASFNSSLAAMEAAAASSMLWLAGEEAQRQRAPPVRVRASQLSMPFYGDAMESLEPLVSFTNTSPIAVQAVLADGGSALPPRRRRRVSLYTEADAAAAGLGDVVAAGAARAGSAPPAAGAGSEGAQPEHLQDEPGPVRALDGLGDVENGIALPDTAAVHDQVCQLNGTLPGAAKHAVIVQAPTPAGESPGAAGAPTSAVTPCATPAVAPAAGHHAGHVPPPGKLAAMLMLSAAVFATNWLKSRVPCGSGLYWAAALSIVPLVIVITAVVRHHLLRRGGQAAAGGQQSAAPAVKVAEGELAWTPVSTVVYPVLCVFAGLMAGLFGVGGGVIKTPLMLELGVPPDVAAASSATMMLFTTSSAAILYTSLGFVLWDYALALFVLALTMALVGQFLTLSLIRALGRRSIIIFMMAALMAIATVLMAQQSMERLAQLAGHPEEVWRFGRVCDDGGAVGLAGACAGP